MNSTDLVTTLGLARKEVRVIMEGIEHRTEQIAPPYVLRCSEYHNPFFL